MDSTGHFITRLWHHNMGDLNIYGIPITKYLFIAYFVTDIFLQDLQDLQIQQESHKINYRNKPLPNLQHFLYNFGHFYSNIISEFYLLCHWLCNLLKWRTIDGRYLVSRNGDWTEFSRKTILGTITYDQLLGNGNIVNSSVWGYLWTITRINHLQHFHSLLC